VLGAAAIALAVACGPLPSDALPISPDGARIAVAEELDVTLERQTSTDSPTLVNVVATYSGAAPDGASVLIVVFDSAAATVQITGRAQEEATVVQEANVVVLITPGDEEAARRVGAALRAAG